MKQELNSLTIPSFNRKTNINWLNFFRFFKICFLLRLCKITGNYYTNRFMAYNHLSVLNYVFYHKRIILVLSAVWSRNKRQSEGYKAGEYVAYERTISASWFIVVLHL